MSRSISLLFAATVAVGALAQGTQTHRTAITNVAEPQPQFQVISPDQVRKIYTQEQALADIKDRLDSIEGSIKEIKTEENVLKDTNTIIKFLVGCFQILVPGLSVTAFGVWLSHHLSHRRSVSPDNV